MNQQTVDVVGFEHGSVPVDGGAPLVPGLSLPIGNSAARGDLLVVVECRGAASPAGNNTTASPNAPPPREARNYRGRY